MTTSAVAVRNNKSSVIAAAAPSAAFAIAEFVFDGVHKFSVVCRSTRYRVALTAHVD